jgi:transcription elongation GreA/GreB family factor
LFILDIEEDLNQLGDLRISANSQEDDQLKKANERIRQLEEMVETLK